MNKSAEISKDGRTLTVNTFKDLKHFLCCLCYRFNMPEAERKRNMADALLLRYEMCFVDSYLWS